MGGGESIIVQEKLSQTEKPPEFSNFLHEKLVLQQHWEGGARLICLGSELRYDTTVSGQVSSIFR